jgi:hypothetical protein
LPNDQLRQAPELVDLASSGVLEITVIESPPELFGLEFLAVFLPTGRELFQGLHFPELL